jgi:hypothetical protein
MSYDLPITGGCHCGAIRWEADDEPNQLYACHCRICQRHTGSAFWVGAKFPEGSFRFVQGTPAVYRSSEILERFYCADCGSSLALKYIEQPWKDRESGFEAAFGSFGDPTPLSPELRFGAVRRLETRWQARLDGRSKSVWDLSLARCDAT